MNSFFTILMFMYIFTQSSLMNTSNLKLHVKKKNKKLQLCIQGVEKEEKEISGMKNTGARRTRDGQYLKDKH